VDLCATSHYASAAVAAPAPKQSGGARRILADRPLRRRRSAIKVQHDGERPRAVLTRGPRRTVHGHRKPRSSATPDSGGGGDCGNDRFSASVLGAQTSASTAKVLPYASRYQAIRLPPARAATPLAPRRSRAANETRRHSAIRRRERIDRADSPDTDGPRHHPSAPGTHRVGSRWARAAKTGRPSEDRLPHGPGRCRPNSTGRVDHRRAPVIPA
jgi:hypothetical protein